jgi:hypothetical protein
MRVSAAFALVEECGLKMSESSVVVRRTFRPKRETIVGKWRRLYSEKLYNL